MVDYPDQAEIIPVVSTEDMLEAATEAFKKCDGMIGAAAPCDYKPIEVADHKIRKTGEILKLKLVETPDVVASLGTGNDLTNGRSDSRWKRKTLASAL